MMRETDKDEWIRGLRFGDGVFVRGHGLSMAAQDLLRKQDPSIDKKASHAALVKATPLLSEADGKTVNGTHSIERYLTDHHKLWILRPASFTLKQKAGMASYIQQQEGKPYAPLTWWENAKKWWFGLWGKAYEVKDTPGEICNEYLWNAIEAAGLPNCPTPGYQLTPSSYLDWFMDVAVPAGTWILVAYYENGRYYLNE